MTYDVHPSSDVAAHDDPDRVGSGPTTNPTEGVNMCGCFVVAMGAFFPRLALIALWIFGPTVGNAFNDSFWVPFLGLILIPYTTLSYVLFFWWLGSVEGFTWFFIALAFIADLGSWTAGARSRPNQEMAA